MAVRAEKEVTKEQKTLLMAERLNQAVKKNMRRKFSQLKKYSFERNTKLKFTLNQLRNAQRSKQVQSVHQL
jgi:hypothetical protein